MNVPFELLTSLMKIYGQTMNNDTKRCSSIATHLRILLPNLSMLSTQDLRVKMPIILSRDGTSIGLSTDLDTLVIGKIDGFYKRIGIEWV
jgi:hypothetical protein